MVIYTLLAALFGIVGGIMIATNDKRTVAVYSGLDKAGVVTNILLTVLYAVFSPFYLFLGMICEPRGEGIVLLLGYFVAIIAASAALFCGLGLGFSVSLRRRGESKESFAVQFIGLAAIIVTVILYAVFAGSLISPLN